MKRVDYESVEKSGRDVERNAEKPEISQESDAKKIKEQALAFFQDFGENTQSKGQRNQRKSGLRKK